MTCLTAVHSCGCQHATRQIVVRVVCELLVAQTNISLEGHAHSTNIYDSFSTDYEFLICEPNTDNDDDIIAMITAISFSH